MKDLLPVKFTYPNSSKTDTPSSTQDKPICPSCSREMTNGTRCVLLISKSPAGAEPPKKTKKKQNGEDGKSKEAACCGHVVCGTCADTVVKPGKQCVVCEASIRSDEDMVDLDKEGEQMMTGLVTRYFGRVETGYTILIGCPMSCDRNGIRGGRGSRSQKGRSRFHVRVNFGRRDLVLDRQWTIRILDYKCVAQSEHGNIAKRVRCRPMIDGAGGRTIAALENERDIRQKVAPKR